MLTINLPVNMYNCLSLYRYQIVWLRKGNLHHQQKPAYYCPTKTIMKNGPKLVKHPMATAMCPTVSLMKYGVMPACPVKYCKVFSVQDITVPSCPFTSRQNPAHIILLNFCRRDVYSNKYLLMSN